jgi:hypothetical protein
MTDEHNAILTQAEKLLTMIEGVMIKVQETRDVELLHTVILRIEEKFKLRDSYQDKKKTLPLERMYILRDILNHELLGDNDEAQVGNYKIIRTYTNPKFLMNQSKALNEIQRALEITEEEAKALVYSYSESKEKIKIL